MGKLLQGYCRLLQVGLTCLMGLMILPVTLQIISRYTDAVPRYIWTEEAARFCFVWIIMLGSILAVREGTHFCVDILPAGRSPRFQAWMRLWVHGAMAVLAAIFGWYGIDFAAFGFRQTSEMSGINMLSIYVSFPLAGFSWVLFLVEKMAADARVLLRAAQPGEPA